MGPEKPTRPWSKYKSLLTPTGLLAVRKGEVLSPATILKTDHFYTGTSQDLGCRILGAPNFRGVEAFDIYGVAQPTRAGLMTVLTLLDCSPAGSQKSCIWLSTREEPLIYINDRPFVLRALKKPFENIQTNTGIKCCDLEEQESRLKENILDEASRSNGIIVIHDEKESGQIVPCLLSLDTVKTPRQVFEEIKASKFAVSYHRLPLSPSQSPTVDFIDGVLTIIKSLDDDHTPLVFSCGMGLVRTTLSMVIGLLIRRSILGGKGLPDPLDSPMDAESASRRSLVRLLQVIRRGMEKDTFLSSRLEPIVNSMLRENMEAVLRGNLILINDLTAALDHGFEVKRTVDRAIDECEHVVNIRESVLLHRLDAEALAFSGNYSKASSKSSLRTAAVFLERYFGLIALGAFLETLHLHPERRFSNWLASRKEVTSMFQKIRPPRVHVDVSLSLFRPLEIIPFRAALEKGMPYDGGTPPDAIEDQHAFPSTPSSLASSTVTLLNSADALAINSRSGRVLGPYRILKNDHWFIKPTTDDAVSALESTALTNSMTMASGDEALEPELYNFRRMSSALPIYGTSQPTLPSLNAIFTKILVEGAQSSLPHETNTYLANADIFAGLDDGLHSAVRSLKELSAHQATASGSVSQLQLPRIIWINLREEPVVYIGNEPYVLRDQYATLRNIRNYAGIDRRNLESLEERLVDDVKAELMSYDDRILLHHEVSGRNGRLVAGEWHSVSPHKVQTPLSAFNDNPIVKAIRGASLAPVCDAAKAPCAAQAEQGIYYYRVPITAEEALEPVDFDGIVNIMLNHYPRRAAVLMNCQIGAGRSTIGMTISAMVLRWLYPCEFDSMDSDLRIITTDLGGSESIDHMYIERKASRAHDCPVIRSLVRVLEHGSLSIENTDTLLDLAASRSQNSSNATSASNAARRGPGLKESIDRYRREAELSPPNSAERTNALRQGVQQLKRYFLLIAFQEYLFSVTRLSEVPTKASESFHSWIKRHREIVHMLENQLNNHAGLAALTPERHLPGSEPLFHGSSGMINLSLSQEVVDAVLANRCHNILQPGTILKQDHFPGCHQNQLMERIEGAPNFRPVALYYMSPQSAKKAPAWLSLKGNLAAVHELLYISSTTSSAVERRERRVYGLAIPTEAAIRTVLDGIGAGFSAIAASQGQRRRIVWTSLREEPVLYIRGSPYVLRTISVPYKNVEATGINRTRVLKMEEEMRDAAREELRTNGGKLLLHAEQLADGVPRLVPMWETMEDGDILTPADIFQKIAAEGFSVDYDRLPITDEQSPMPHIFDSIFERYRNLSQDVDTMFNCQMGRGRTTTGMIIAVLIEIVLHRARLLPRVIFNDNSKAAHFVTDATSQTSSAKTKYLSGQYTLVESLVRVLGYGKLAKYLTDVCIDGTDHIQNLRTAIYYNKVKAESAFPSNPHDFEIALQYLVRYFYLITFANYLLEREAAVGQGPWRPFSEWLEDRKEVTSLVREKLHEVDLS